MGAQIATQAILLLLGNLPAAITTAQQVFGFVSHGLITITAAVGSKETVTTEELMVLVKKVADQHAAIAAIP